MKASFDNTNQQSLQAQLAQLQAQAQTNARSGYGFDRNLQDRISALQNQMNTQAMTANAAKGGGVDEVADAKKKILDYTAGRGDAVMNDAMTNAALARLDSVSAGKDAPFTQAVQNQMLAQSAGMNASAAGDQAEQLRMQAAGVGGSLADPSYQARLRQINAQRTSANANAQGQIATTAQLQNFGARQTGTNALLAGRAGQMGMANSQYNQAAGYLNQTSQDAGHQSGVQMPQILYNFGQQQGGNLQLPQTPAIQYQQNKPQAAPAQQQQTNAAPTPTQIPSVIHADNRGYGNTPLSGGPKTNWGPQVGAPVQPAFNANVPGTDPSVYANQLLKGAMPSIMYRFS